MSILRYLLAICFLLSGACSAARAQSFVNQEMQKETSYFFLNGYRNSISHKLLSTNCIGFRSVRAEIPCNPALIDEPKFEDEDNPSVFAANILFGNDYETIYKNRDLIRGSNKLKLAESLLSEKDPVRFEGGVGLWWRGVNYSLSYIPARWTYYSQVNNPSYPEVFVHAMQEQHLVFQAGGRLNDQFRAGYNLRFVDRQFVQDNFEFFEAISDVDQLFKVKSQKLWLLEPGFSYLISKESNNWRPMLSMQLSQLGWASEKHDEAPLKPVLETSFSVLSPISLGELELAAGYQWVADLPAEQNASLSASYELGLAKFIGTVGENLWSMGVQSTYRNIGLGLGYIRRSDNALNRSLSLDSGFVDLKVSL